MKIFSSATSLFVSHFVRFSLSALHWMTLSLIHIFSGSHASFPSQDVLAALCVACLLVDDPLSRSLSQSFHVSLAAPRFLARLLQQQWPGFNGSPISLPVWGRAGSFWGALNIAVQWQRENETRWMRMSLLFRKSVSSFYCCNGESKGCWTMTPIPWTAQARPVFIPACHNSFHVRCVNPRDSGEFNANFIIRTIIAKCKSMQRPIPSVKVSVCVPFIMAFTT